jgi:Formylglycinamide ribonucleotide amidotransferase N-terminal
MTELIHYYRKISDDVSSKDASSSSSSTASTITTATNVVVSLVRDGLTDQGFDKDAVISQIRHIDTEFCYNILLSPESSSLTTEQTMRLEWLLAETFEPHHLQRDVSFYTTDTDANTHTHTHTHTHTVTLEYGPRMTFTSAFSSNATSICQACGIPVDRLELSKRYRFCIRHPITTETTSLLDETTKTFTTPVLRILHSLLHDRMTEELYETPLRSFGTVASSTSLSLPSYTTAVPPKSIRTIPIMTQGRAALETINREMGLGFDDFDLDYYTKLFKVRQCTSTQYLYSFNISPIMFSSQSHTHTHTFRAYFPLRYRTH